MTDIQIQQEVEKDWDNIGRYLMAQKKDFGRAVLKRSIFPYVRTYRYTTNGNKYLIALSAEKRADHKNPIFSLMAYWTTKKGVSAYLYTKKPVIYTPHFIQRYKERYLTGADTEKVLSNILSNDCRLFETPLTEEIIRYSDELHDVTNKKAFIMESGLGLGKEESGCVILKTYVHTSMLYDNQKDFCDPVQHQLRNTTIDKNGKTILRKAS